MGMSDTEIQSARASLDREMIQELLARRERAKIRKAELLNAAKELAQIEQTLTVIGEELQAYGYVEPGSEAANTLALNALAGLGV